MCHNKIKEARKAKGWTQQDLAERMGTTQQTIQRYENGSRNLRASVLANLSRVLDVTVAYLLGMTDENDVVEQPVNVPLYGTNAAGNPLETQSTEAFHPIPSEVHRRWPDAFLLRIEGESMNRILPNGCYALVDPCTEIDFDRQPYAVQVGDSDATVKRVHMIADGFELLPDSTDPTFRPMVYSSADQSEGNLSIIGRVVWHCIPYDWSY